MEAMGVTREQTGVLSREKLAQAAFGALCQDFALGIISRAGWQDGLYQQVALEFLEEPEAEPVPAAEPVLRIDLKLVLEALQRESRETRAAQRLLERVIHLQTQAGRQGGQPAGRAAEAPLALQQLFSLQAVLNLERDGGARRPEQGADTLARSAGRRLDTLIAQAAEASSALPRQELSRPGGLGRRALELARQVRQELETPPRPAASRGGDLRRPEELSLSQAGGAAPVPEPRRMVEQTVRQAAQALRHLDERRPSAKREEEKGVEAVPPVRNAPEAANALDRASDRPSAVRPADTISRDVRMGRPEQAAPIGKGLPGEAGQAAPPHTDLPPEELAHREETAQAQERSANVPPARRAAPAQAHPAQRRVSEGREGGRSPLASPAESGERSLSDIPGEGAGAPARDRSREAAADGTFSSIPTAARDIRTAGNSEQAPAAQPQPMPSDGPTLGRKNTRPPEELALRQEAPPAAPGKADGTKTQTRSGAALVDGQAPSIPTAARDIRTAGSPEQTPAVHPQPMPSDGHTLDRKNTRPPEELALRQEASPTTPGEADGAKAQARSGAALADGQASSIPTAARDIRTRRSPEQAPASAARLQNVRSAGIPESPAVSGSVRDTRTAPTRAAASFPGQPDGVPQSETNLRPPEALVYRETSPDVSASRNAARTLVPPSAPPTAGRAAGSPAEPAPHGPDQRSPLRDIRVGRAAPLTTGRRAPFAPAFRKGAAAPAARPFPDGTETLTHRPAEVQASPAGGPAPASSREAAGSPVFAPPGLEPLVLPTGERAPEAAGLPPAADRGGDGLRPVALTYVPAHLGSPPPPPALDSDYVRSLPQWARDFLHSSPASPAVPPVVTTARPISSQPAPAAEQVEWSAPALRRPPAPAAETALRQREEPRRDAARQPARLSDTELRRTADKVYQLLEARLRQERRRLGL